MYESLSGLLGQHDLLSGLRRVPGAELVRTAAQNPGLPTGYLAYLRDVGEGLAGTLRVLPHPMAVTDVYGRTAAERLPRVLIVATFDTGECVGFDLDRDWELVEINEAREVRRQGRSFEEFVETAIRRALAD
jgi:hypothetical protein